MPISRSALMVLLVVGAACLLPVPPALAEDAASPAQVVVEPTATPFDAASVPWFNEATRAILDPIVAEHAKGGLSYVIAAAPSGNWGFRYLNNGTVDVSLADVATAVLQQCQFYSLAPCRLVAADGKATRRADGSWADQPPLIAYGPAEFDPLKTPFLVERDRIALFAYRQATKPKALLVSDNGYFYWVGAAATLEDAIKTSREECKKQSSGSDCVVYAINDIVVLQPY